MEVGYTVIWARKVEKEGRLGKPRLSIFVWSAFKFEIKTYILISKKESVRQISLFQEVDDVQLKSRNNFFF